MPSQPVDEGCACLRSAQQLPEGLKMENHISTSSQGIGDANYGSFWTAMVSATLFLGPGADSVNFLWQSLFPGATKWQDLALSCCFHPGPCSHHVRERDCVDRGGHHVWQAKGAGRLQNWPLFTTTVAAALASPATDFELCLFCLAWLAVRSCCCRR